jgi:hypothetical protein
MLKRKTDHWNRLFDLLLEGNKRRTRNSAVIVVAIARKNEYNENSSLPINLMPVLLVRN